MKKSVKHLSALLMTAMLILSLAACGGGGGKASESKVKGNTYAFESCTVGGEDNTAALAAMYKEQTFAFKDDGSCVQTIVWADELAETMGTDPVEVTGSYEENGDTVTVTFKIDGEDDTVMEFTVESDTLKLAEDDTTMVYKLNANS